MKKNKYLCPGFEKIEVSASQVMAASPEVQIGDYNNPFGEETEF